MSWRVGCEAQFILIIQVYIQVNPSSFYVGLTSNKNVAITENCRLIKRLLIVVVVVGCVRESGHLERGINLVYLLIGCEHASREESAEQNIRIATDKKTLSIVSLIVRHLRSLPKYKLVILLV